MLPRVSVVAALLAATLLAACGSDKGRFVRPVPMPVSDEATEVNASRWQDGYLRIFVSSNLDTSGRMMDFGKEGQRPAMLLISARFGKGTVASFAADAEPEIPVLLYDVQSGQTMSSVVDNALLTSGLLIDPESLSTSPHLQIFVRGVPQDKARWVTDLLELATAEPVLSVGLSFVPGGAALSPLSTKLGSMLSDEIKTSNKPWEEKTLLGMRADEGLASLDGRQFVVLLNPTTIDLEAPPTLTRCRTSAASVGLCTSDGETWEPQQAYVRFELDVSDYRTIRDFLGSEPSCEASDRFWSDYRTLLASGQLASRQLEYERHLLARGDLLADVRRSLSDYAPASYPSRLLLHAQQFILLPTPDDAYWQEHFADQANQLDACIRRAASRGQTQDAAVWDLATQAYAQRPQYPTWAETLAANADPDAPALQAAERELQAVQRLVAMDELRNLDAAARGSLNGLLQPLERMLLASYRRIARSVELSDPPVELRIEALRRLANETACAPCADLLIARADALVPPPPEAPLTTDPVGMPSTDAAARPPGDAPMASEMPGEAPASADEPAVPTSTPAPAADEARGEAVAAPDASEDAEVPPAHVLPPGDDPL